MGLGRRLIHFAEIKLAAVEASGVEKVVFLKVTLKVCDPWFLLA